MSGRIGTGGTGGSTFGLPEMFGGLYGVGFSIGSAGFSIGFSIGSVGFSIGCVGGGGGNVGGAVGLTTSGETEGTGGLGVSLGGLGISLGGLVGMGAGGRVGLVSSLDSISTSPDSSGSIGRLSICCGTSISSSSVIGLSFT
ncbi:hypothetical protein AA984_21930 [Brevibacillus formosus]|uniref:Uncharacterized protein n=1 Tax=Brevibacillus formosus TaxID=54913 RepID=A0A837KHI5_9BACL|nr:hypothetical protein AA984_21930 [Brevibacillus formosus]GED58794.1 hypothetical protein BFO01nite_29260 [Brevibacillus formosus]